MSISFSKIDFSAGVSFGFTFSLWVCTWAEMAQTIYIPYTLSPSPYATKVQYIDITLFSEVFRDNLLSDGDKGRAAVIGMLVAVTLISFTAFLLELLRGTVDAYENYKLVYFEIFAISLKIMLLIITLYIFDLNLKEGVFFPGEFDTYEGTFHAAQFISIPICVIDAVLLIRRTGVLEKFGYRNKSNASDY